MKNKTMSIKHLASAWYIEPLHTQYHLGLIIMINIFIGRWAHLSYTKEIDRISDPLIRYFFFP